MSNSSAIQQDNFISTNPEATDQIDRQLHNLISEIERVQDIIKAAKEQEDRSEVRKFKKELEKLTEQRRLLSQQKNDYMVTNEPYAAENLLDQYVQSELDTLSQNREKFTSGISDPSQFSIAYQITWSERLLQDEVSYHAIRKVQDTYTAFISGPEPMTPGSLTLMKALTSVEEYYRNALIQNRLRGGSTSDLSNAVEAVQRAAYSSLVSGIGTSVLHSLRMRVQYFIEKLPLTPAPLQTEEKAEETPAPETDLLPRYLPKYQALQGQYHLLEEMLTKTTLTEKERKSLRRKLQRVNKALKALTAD